MNFSWIKMQILMCFNAAATKKATHVYLFDAAIHLRYGDRTSKNCNTKDIQRCNIGDAMFLAKGLNIFCITTSNNMLVILTIQKRCSFTVPKYFVL